MSFDVHLTVADLTTSEARRISHLAAELGTWPVGYSPATTTRRLRDRFQSRHWDAALWMPERQGSFCDGLLGDEARLTDEYWAVRPIYRSRLAAALQLLGNQLPQGYRFMANWIGTKIEREVTLAAVELAALARNARLSESTRYIVPPRPARDAAGGGGGTGSPAADAHRPPHALAGLPACEFADPGPLRDKIIASLLAGEKTATSSLLGQYADEDLPAAGQRLAVVDSAEQRVAVIEVTGVDIVRLGEVDEPFALAEGEGFRCLQDWRTAHEEFWRSDDEVTALGIGVSDETLVVTERFRLVEPLA